MDPVTKRVIAAIEERVVGIRSLYCADGECAYYLPRSLVHTTWFGDAPGPDKSPYNKTLLLHDYRVVGLTTEDLSDYIIQCFANSAVKQDRFLSYRSVKHYGCKYEILVSMLIDGKRIQTVSLLTPNGT